MITTLDRFIQRFKLTDRRSRANLQSLKGGRWFIPPEHKDEFFSHYETAVLQKKYYFVFKGPNTKLQPFRMDIDFKTEKKTELNLETAFEFTRKIATTCFQQPCEFYIVAKECGYFKKINKHDQYATGFHVYFPRTRLSLSDCDRVRNFAVQIIDSYFQDSYLNDPEDQVDKRVTHRCNGLMLVGCYKKGSEQTGRYSFKVGYSSDCEDPYIFEPNHESFGDGCRQLYDFIFDDDDEDYVPADVSLPKQPVTKTRQSNRVCSVVCKSPVQFNLVNFLKITKGYIPKNKEYKQILGYLKSVDYDAEQAQRLCNAAWNYSGNETRDYIHKIFSGQVGKGSIIRILKDHASSVWTDRDLWTLNIDSFTKFNHIIDHLTKMTVSEEELNRIFKNVFVQTWGSGSQQYLYTEDRYLKCGDENILTSNFVISQKNPFANYDRKIGVKCMKTRKMALGYMKKCKNQTKAYLKLQADEPNLTTKALILELVRLYNFVPKHIVRENLSVHFRKCCEDDHLRTYHSFVSRPYLTESDRERLTPVNTINIYPLNYLINFKPTLTVEIKSTLTWYWLKHIICNGDEYKLDWISCYHREKIVNAHRKIEKILVFYSQNTGTGKSSHRVFMTQLLGKAHVYKIDSVMELFKSFNSTFLNKLLIYVDDADRLTKTEADQLKSKTTETTFTYQKKFEDSIDLDAYHDLVVSTNKSNCMYVSPTDRRVEIIHVLENFIHPKLKAEEFWNLWYKERQDPNIGKAFQEYFMNYKSNRGLNVRRKETRFSNQDLDKLKLNSSKTSYIFLAQLFENMYFYEAAIDVFKRRQEPHYNTEYFDDFDFVDLNFVCKHKFLFKLFRTFVKDTGRKSQLASGTLKQQLEDLGLTTSSVRFRGKRNHKCWQLNPDVIRLALTKKIPNMEIPNHCFPKPVTGSPSADLLEENKQINDMRDLVKTRSFRFALTL